MVLMKVYAVVLVWIAQAAVAVPEVHRVIGRQQSTAAVVSTAVQSAALTPSPTLAAPVSNATSSIVINPANPSKSAILVLDPTRAHILEPLPTTGWTGQCMQAVLYDYALVSNVSEFPFVGLGGGLTHRDLDGDTWGITYQQCEASCGTLDIYFDFSQFANAATNYILPWLGLCAQLPYENGNWAHSLLSVLLALGSPGVATFSLFLSMLSVLRIRNTFNRLEAIIDSDKTDQRSMVRNLKRIMLQALQEPLVLWGKEDSVSTLLLDGRTGPYWEAIADAARGSRRGVTLSLVAQMAFAAIAFLFTVIASLEVNLGDEATMLQISNGGLWLWLIPVVLGWVCLRNQSSADTLERAFKKMAAAMSRAARLRTPAADVHATLQTGKSPRIDISGPSPGCVTPHSTLPDHGIPIFVGQHDELSIASTSRPRSVMTRSDLIFSEHAEQDRLSDAAAPGGEPHPRPQIINVHDFQTSARRPDPEALMFTTVDIEEQPDFVREASMTLHDSPFEYSQWITWLCNFSGDTLWQGAMFNYARFIRYDETLSAVEYIIEQRIKANRDVACGVSRSVDGKEAATLLERTCKRPIDMRVMFKLIGAFIVSIFVLWGTAGASIIVAYKTETIGLGCRSGSYLLYAIMATIVLGLLGTSELLSHRGGLALASWRSMSSRLAQPSPTTARFDSVDGDSSDGIDGRPSMNSGMKNTARQSGAAQFPALTRTNTYIPSKMPNSQASLATLQTRYRRFLIASTITQVLGRFLAVLNACFLIVIAILEPVGVYNNCYCQSTALQLGDGGWLVLFKQAKDLASQSQAPTGGGVALGLITCFAAGFLFLLGALSHQRG